MGENHQARRLLVATVAAFAPLAEFGFRVEREPDPEDWRGATVEVGSDTVTITVWTDWWDNLLQVWVTVAGAERIGVVALVPELRSIGRIARSATRGALQSRLERVVEAIRKDAPELLDGGGPALDRVLRAGARAERDQLGQPS
jgi:hypothetical protein